MDRRALARFSVNALAAVAMIIGTLGLANTPAKAGILDPAPIEPIPLGCNPTCNQDPWCGDWPVNNKYYESHTCYICDWGTIGCDNDKGKKQCNPWWWHNVTDPCDSSHVSGTRHDDLKDTCK